MKLKFSITFYFFLCQILFLFSIHLTAQNVFCTRDSIKNSLTNPGFLLMSFKIDEDVKSENKNYLIASQILYNDYCNSEIYFTFYFDKNDICIKAVRFIPNCNFQFDLADYNTKLANYNPLILDLSKEGIKYAWFTDESKKLVAYFDPILSKTLETHYAITFEPYSVFQPETKKKTKKK